jgi:hypothetical protein
MQLLTQHLLHSLRTVDVGGCLGKGPSSITSQRRLALKSEVAHPQGLVACCGVLWCAVVCCVCVPRYVDAALYLTELQSDGVLGAVGVTNFDVPRLEAMVNQGAQLVSNQVGGAAP